MQDEIAIIFLICVLYWRDQFGFAFSDLFLSRI